MAEEAERIGSSDPESARDLGSWVVANSTDSKARTTAYRAIGVAERTLRNAEGMESALVAAVEIAEAAGLSEELAFGQVLLAGAHTIAGRTTKSLELLDEAIGNLTGERQLLARIQKGIVRSQSGDFAGALAELETLSDYIETLPTYRQAIYHTNRAQCLLQLNRPSEAIPVFEAALGLYELTGESHLSLNTLFNLARAYAVAGLTQGALACFDRIDVLNVGPMQGVDWSDRAAVLLSAGLLAEAEDAALHARRAAVVDGDRTWLPTAAMIHAETLEARGNLVAAQDAARSAASLYADQDRPNMHDLATSIALRCEATVSGGEVVSLEAARVSLRLRDWGAELEALSLDLAVARQSVDESIIRRHLEVALSSEASGVEEAMLHSEAVARLAKLNGDRALFDVAVESGFAAFTEWRQSLGSTELQAAAARTGAPLGQLGVADAVERGDPYRTLEAVERLRLSAIVSSATAADDLRLQELLSKYRELSGHFETGDWREERVRLESEIRQYARTQSRSATPLDAPDVMDALTLLGNRTLIEFVDVDEDLFALVHHHSGPTRLCRLGRHVDIRQEIDSLRASITRLSSSGGSRESRAAFGMVLRTAGENLSSFLIDSLIEDDREVLIVPSMSLADVPWSALTALRRRVFAVAPSLRMWAALLSQPTGIGAVAVGLEDPPSAISEAETVAGLHGGDLLVGPDATVERVLEALNGVGVAHLACHGEFRSDNALMSAVRMADGPLTVYDIERLPTPPTTLIFSACEVAQTHRLAGEALLGMSASLMASGTRSIIAATTVVSDEMVKSFMSKWHRAHLEGATPAAALAQARMESDNSDAMLALTASFVCIGV